jgi:hypothetical protein
VGALDDDCKLAPIDLGIEVNTKPATMSHVGWPKEASRIRLDQHLLGPFRSGAPRAQAVVVVMVRCGGKFLSGHEPCRFSVAEAFGDLWQAHTELSKSLDLGRVAWSLHSL